MKKNGTSTSACNNVNDVAGGRKTLNSIVVETGGGGEEGAVLVSFGIDDAVVFAYEEVESVPSLETEEDDDTEEEEEEEEEEEDWESEDEEGEWYLLFFSSVLPFWDVVSLAMLSRPCPPPSAST